MSSPMRRIKVGSKVSAKIGPLEDPKLTVDQLTGKSRRRLRTVFHGIIVKSMPDSKWLVHWDECDKTSTHTSYQLTFIGDTEELNPLLMTMWEENERIYIGGHIQMLAYTKDMPIPAITTNAATASPPSNSATTSDPTSDISGGVGVLDVRGTPSRSNCALRGTSCGGGGCIGLQGNPLSL